MALAFADGVAAIQNFEMVSGDAAYLDFAVLDETTKLEADLSPYTEILWELELVEGQVAKSLSNGDVTVTNNVIRIPIEALDTNLLHGLYTHQLRLQSALGEPKTIVSGTGLFKSQVFT